MAPQAPQAPIYIPDFSKDPEKTNTAEAKAPAVDTKALEEVKFPPNGAVDYIDTVLKFPQKYADRKLDLDNNESVSLAEIRIVVKQLMKERPDDKDLFQVLEALDKIIKKTSDLKTAAAIDWETDSLPVKALETVRDIFNQTPMSIEVFQYLNKNFAEIDTDKNGRLKPQEIKDFLSKRLTEFADLEREGKPIADDEKKAKLREIGILTVASNQIESIRALSNDFWSNSVHWGHFGITQSDLDEMKNVCTRLCDYFSNDSQILGSNEKIVTAVGMDLRGFLDKQAQEAIKGKAERPKTAKTND